MAVRPHVTPNATLAEIAVATAQANPRLFPDGIRAREVLAAAHARQVPVCAGRVQTDQRTARGEDPLAAIYFELRAAGSDATVAS